MRSFRIVLGSRPLLPRAIVVAVVIGGVAGATTGLLVGLAAYPPTAAFAVVELGVPAAIAGAFGDRLVDA